MIPAIYDPQVSAGEKKVFQLLQGCQQFAGAMAFHSVGLMHHPTKPVAELDFVVAGQQGLLILEVKGGSIGQQAGRFYSRDRFGVEHGIQNPFRQAQSGAFALLADLEGRLPDLKRRMLTGFAVVLPDTTFDIRSVEWDPDIVIDRRDCGSPRAFAAALRRVYGYWETKLEPRPLTGMEVQKICRTLRPEFERAMSISGLVGEASTQQLALTEEQYDFLDTITANPRVLCTGGAGTGKTFLLVEAARRLAAQGQDVLVTCFSPLLAGHLSGILRNEHVRVIPYGELASLNEPCDVLLIDEGQDIMSLDSLIEVLDSCVRGGLDHGCWVIFYDGNLQARIHGQFSLEAEDLLKRTGAAQVPLRRNCRNTREIASSTMLRTGGDIGNAMSGSGILPAEVSWKDQADQAAHVTRIIRECRLDGVRAGEIAVISPLPLAQSVASQLSRDIIVKPWAQAGPDDIRFATVDESKGLESPYVILTDLDAGAFPSDELATARLYVGMTRARAALWLLISTAYRSHLDQLAMKHISLMAERNI